MVAGLRVCRFAEQQASSSKINLQNGDWDRDWELGLGPHWWSLGWGLG